jgi:hydroxylamine dehydrogenase
MALAATKLLVEAWNIGLADKSNPFDEAIEHKWLEQWLFYANSVRYGSAMSGPDYAAFKNGWWKLTKNLEDMQHFIH